MPKIEVKNAVVDITGDELQAKYDAVVLAGGSESPRDLPVPGRELDGVHFAMDFLPQQNRRVGQDPIGDIEPITATDKHVVVIGGGPAGVSSAIYAARKGLNVSIVSEKFGGQLTETVGIENFISNPYTTGKELTSNLFNHAKEYDIILKEHVQVEKIGGEDIKSITLSSGEKMESRSVIIATGAKWRNLNIPGEKEYLGKGCILSTLRWSFF